MAEETETGTGNTAQTQNIEIQETITSKSRNALNENTEFLNAERNHCDVLISNQTISPEPPSENTVEDQTCGLKSTSPEPPTENTNDVQTCSFKTSGSSDEEKTAVEPINDSSEVELEIETQPVAEVLSEEITSSRPDEQVEEIKPIEINDSANALEVNESETVVNGVSTNENIQDIVPAQIIGVSLHNEKIMSNPSDTLDDVLVLNGQASTEKETYPLRNGECKLEHKRLEETEFLNGTIANELKTEDYKLPDVVEVKKNFEYMQPILNNESPSVPKKGALSTSLDIRSIKQSYEDVRCDSSETQWAVYKFEGPTIVTSSTGSEFGKFQSQFKDDERAFGYIRVQTGDEMSRRAKFLFLTWIGPSVSVLKRAKMSTDKALIKGIVSNFAVELQTENSLDINLQNFEHELDKAGGAHYGTGH